MANPSVLLRRLRAVLLLLGAGVLAMPLAADDFNTGWMRSDYWTDGKAEFNIYEAALVRYGQPRPGSEVIHILVRESFAPDSLVKADDWRQPGSYPVLKLNQILRVPTGLYVYQQMHSAFWSVDTARLIKATLTSNDSCGNTFKLIERRGDDLVHEWETYWQGMVSGSETIRRPANGYFHEELPVLVRMIDFSGAPAAIPIRLAPDMINSKRDDIRFRDAVLDVERADGAGTIRVTARGEHGTDVFTLGAEFPHLLLSWERADGGHLRLTDSLKVDYWNFNRPGDRERALADPDLRLFPKPLTGN